MQEYILTKPLTPEEIKAKMDEDNYITENIIVHLSDIIDMDLESFLDHLSITVTDSPLLMDINYDAIGILNKNNIIIQVHGDVSNIIEND